MEHSGRKDKEQEKGEEMERALKEKHSLSYGTRLVSLLCVFIGRLCAKSLNLSRSWILCL